MAFEKSVKGERQLLLPDELFTDNLVIDDTSSLQDSFETKLEELKAQLQIALELEHSTIPPYLCALYSIKPGTNLMPVEIIKSVVLEEMLHMIMVANLINAVGGKPEIGAKEKGKDRQFVPNYPTCLPGNVDPSLTVSLDSFSKKTIQTFWRIEHPSSDHQLPTEFSAPEYGSIGEFYEALLKNMIALESAAKAKGGSIFHKDHGRQVKAEHYYGAGGKLFSVENLEDAIKVIEEIVGQGEGTLGSIFSTPYREGDPKYLIFGPNVEEYAHYFRFKEVFYERFYAVDDSAHRDSPNKGLPTGERFDVDWDAVCKMKPNPRLADYKDMPQVYEKAKAFSYTYSALLNNINEACNGKPEVLGQGIPLMFQLKYQAVELMNIPIGNGLMAGPTFEYIK
ncbi:ferritin-like domain-containing protein [Chitinophaga sp. RAB17]|uniref:ferritin-like domain-containing protein n=1 Tax=Chitinophaga sp. RAB17 TaxID=3233049 RepID=UPI003F9302D1